MKKNTIKKFFTMLMIIVILATIFLNTNVKAATDNAQSSEDEINEIIEKISTEEKIMKYDALTNETTEVDMNEVRNALKLQYRENVNKTPVNIIDSSKIKINHMPTVNNKENSLNDRNGAQLVSNTYAVAHLQTCRITVYSTNINQTVAMGTATIVGPKLALTAAHCVFDPVTKQAYSNWTIYPGYNNGTYYGTATGWSTVYYSSAWMNDTSNYGADWAICVLNTSPGVGNLGTVSYNSAFTGLSITLLGYPTDKDYGYNNEGRYQYSSSGVVSTVLTDRFFHTAFGCLGFSGGPVLRSDNYVAGVNTGVGNSTGTSHAARINQNMIDLINNLYNT